jgi:hypothetical protein
LIETTVGGFTPPRPKSTKTPLHIEAGFSRSDRQTEPRRVRRRPFGLSRAMMAGSSSIA